MREAPLSSPLSQQKISAERWRDSTKELELMVSWDQKLKPRSKSFLRSENVAGAQHRRQDGVAGSPHGPLQLTLTVLCPVQA